MKVLAVLGLAVALLSGCGGTTTAQPVPTVTVTQPAPSATNTVAVPSQTPTAVETAETKAAQAAATKAAQAAVKAAQDAAAKAQTVATAKRKKCLEDAEIYNVVAQGKIRIYREEIASLELEKQQWLNPYGDCFRNECAIINSLIRLKQKDIDGELAAIESRRISCLV